MRFNLDAHELIQRNEASLLLAVDTHRAAIHLWQARAKRLP
jgi:hypothetical protein